jgi:serine/threonine-protein kinase RsbW
MHRLKITTRHDRTKQDVIVLDLQGVLDESAVGIFTEIWKTLPEHVTSLILNFRDVTVMNEFGAGFVAGLAENFSRIHSEIKLVTVPAKIRHAFAAAAPLKHLHFYPNEQAALLGRQTGKPEPYFDHFTIQPSSPDVQTGLPFAVRVEARDAQDKLFAGYEGTPHIMANKGMIAPNLLQNFRHGVWSGNVILTGPGRITVKVWDDTGAGEFAVEVLDQGEKVEFPIQVVCPGCGKTNIAGKSDIFRCIKCNFIYFVDIRGRLIPLKSGGHGEFIKTLEFKIPSDINYLNHVRNFIVGVTREENLGEEKISQIEMSLDEALANVVEHAYTFDSHQDIQVLVTLYPDRLDIVIRDHGRSFNNDLIPLPNIKEHIEQRRVGGLGRYLMKTLMDEVEYRSDNHTNELRMMKRF